MNPVFETKKSREIYEQSKLGVAIFNANLSIRVVAWILQVKRQTVYNWFDTRRKISHENALKRDALIGVITNLIEKQILPSTEPDQKVATFVQAQFRSAYEARLAAE